MADAMPVIDGLEIDKLIWKNNVVSFFSGSSSDGPVTIALPTEHDQAVLEKFAYQLVISRKVAGIKGVLNLLESGTNDETIPYIVYDQVTVSSLSSEIEANGGLDWQEAIEVVKDIGETVEHLHAVGVSMISLSLDSLRIAEDGSPIISELDSAQFDKNARPSSEVTPEDLEYERDNDTQEEPLTEDSQQLDIRSLGNLFWSVVQSEAPSSDSTEILIDVLAENVPTPVCEVVALAMAEDLAEVPESVGDFIAQLEAAAIEADEASKPVTPPPSSDTVMFQAPDGQPVADEDSEPEAISKEKLVETGQLEAINFDEVVEVVTAPASEESSRGFPWFAIAASSIVTAIICIGGFALFSNSLLGRQSIDDFVGMQLSDAEDALRDVDIVIETQPGRSDGSEPGEILEQIPRPGTVVDSGSVVRFTVSQGSELRELPDPEGLEVSEIEAALAAQEFSLGEVTEERDSATVAEGLGIEFVIDGESVDGEYPGGTEFDLVVSTGLVTVPRISGDQIESILVIELGLEVEIIEEFSEDIDLGEVIRTVPPTGDKVKQRSKITVFVATDVDPPTVRVPGVVGRGIKDAVNRIRAAGFNPAFAASLPGNCDGLLIGEARTRCRNAEGGKVWKIEPDSAEAFEGSTITLYASQQAINEYKNQSDDD